MRKGFFSAGIIVFTVLVFLAVYSGYGGKTLSIVLRWGEIIIALSFAAGLLRYLGNEIGKIRKSIPGKWSSIVILISFLITFFAGVMNVNESKYTFNNIVREHPPYLYEVSNIIIEDDSYLGRFPARKKLSLYISANVSPYFYPTDEILKDAELTREEFRKMRDDSASASDGGFLLNRDDARTVDVFEEKIRTVSIEAISEMLPVSGELKKWFSDSFTMLLNESIRNEKEDETG